MENLEPLLAKHPFFQDLKPEHLKVLVGCASNVVFNSGQFLFREGEDANQFYIIRQGKVGVETFSPVRGAIPIHTRGQGEALGWSWLIAPYKWHFDARAYELTRAIALDGKCLRDKCAADHDFGYEILKRVSQVIAERLEATRLQLLDMYGDH
jgi:CRP/FNR family transcriptional regulator, cyclic AMP receptor protein